MSLLQRRLHKAKKERKMRFGTALIGCIHAVCTVGDQSVLWSCCPATISMFLVCEPTRGSYAVASHRVLLVEDSYSLVATRWNRYMCVESLYACWTVLLAWSLLQQWHLWHSYACVTQKPFRGREDTTMSSLHGCFLNLKDAEKVCLRLHPVARAFEMRNAMHMLWL